ncbi:MAG: UDP-N-acetylmuramoyl-L-alanyl-D-glutamate--2,6-diaminopimelate ligase, partial [Bdellovibrionales bacterium]|nr:UDP-N-acetylmuramoyl-L-alanyl-D-glutamate--2,6-diaminopimelate ligase [Bdellovibrionales bacterium]
MKLAQLFSIYPEYRVGETIHKDVVNICRDSRDVVPGSVFVAISGYKVDGHEYISKAIENGAIGIVAESTAKIPKEYSGAVVIVTDTRVALQKLASHFYGNPASELFCVGVTGTNGKTTITYMVEAILNHYGWPTGVLGTINHHLGDHVWKSSLTTPDAVDLQRRLREFCALGAKAVVFEVSSHALSQYRVDEVPFDVTVFSNLSRDHLDYHLTMENYFHSKERLFTDVLAQSSKSEIFAVINQADEYGQKIFPTDRAHVFRYGERDVDISFTINKMDFQGSEFEIITSRGTVEVQLPIPGLFNIYNALAASGVGLAAHISLSKIAEALSEFQGVPGRLQRVPLSDVCRPAIFIDYAHTPDALEKVLESLNEVRKASQSQGQIITVFGCGGDRDKGKRPIMGSLAEKYSDLIFITSDNPRTEDPEQIIQDVLVG